MKNEFYRPNETRCEVCEYPVSYLEFLEQRRETTLVCRSGECRRIIGGKKNNLSYFKYRVESYRTTLRHLRLREKEKKDYLLRIEKQEPLENRSILHLASEIAPACSGHPPHVVSIPTGLTTLDSPGEDDLKSYRGHLESIIEKAFSTETATEAAKPVEKDAAKIEDPPGVSVTNPALTAVRERLCGICKGGCCTEGANRAYLTELTIRRVRQTYPELSAGHILSKYLSLISDQTIKNSCINQTQTGCSLPRDLRSDTCIAYFCKDLRDLEDKFVDESPVPVLAVKRSNHKWNRFDDTFENEIVEITLVDDEGDQPLDSVLQAWASLRGAPPDRS